MKLRWRKIGNKNLFARGNSISRTDTSVHGGREEWGKTILHGKRREKERLWLKGGIKRHVTEDYLIACENIWMA